MDVISFEIMPSIYRRQPIRSCDCASGYRWWVLLPTISFIVITPLTFMYVLGIYTRYPFWCCVIPTNIPRKPFFAWWRIFNAFLPTWAVAFRTTHGQNNTRKCDTEGFVPVASLYGEVGSPSPFISYLIGRTGKIQSVVYINAKWIYTSKTLECIIRECAIVRNVLCVTSACLLISWCSSATNFK